MRTMRRVIFLLVCGLCIIYGLSLGPDLRESQYKAATSRRAFVSLLTFVAQIAFASISLADPRSTVTLRLNSPNDKAGLKLTNVIIGTPPRTAVAVEHVLTGGAADRAGIQEGVILLDYGNAKQVSDKLKIGPYPVELKFYNLAAGGDAFGDLNKPLVTAKDALDLAKRTSGDIAESPTGMQQEYTIRVLKQTDCKLKSRRGDVLEINYEAHITNAEGPVYDSSSQRGTGQPYQFVLGSGDMISGVDRGLYDMCPGEVRLLEIPPALGYGPRASKLYGIPSQSPLYWRVELVTVNSVREGDERDRDELEGRVW